MSFDVLDLKKCFSSSSVEFDDGARRGEVRLLDDCGGLNNVLRLSLRRSEMRRGDHS